MKSTNDDQPVIDLLGVGIGPFNMSLAALLSPLKAISSRFFDRSPSFVWHSGMLLPESEIQVSYLKDLVTLADPANPYSFIAYLAKHKRLYRFMNARFQQVLRPEFNQYLTWVSRSLDNLYFDEAVESIRFDKTVFLTQTSKRIVRSRNLVLGSGLSPYIPECAKAHAGTDIFHAKDYLAQSHRCSRKRVMIIGGGQSGADIVNHLLSNGDSLPAELVWVTKRSIFSPMDDSVFANEYFTPVYNDYFFSLPAYKKSRFLQEQILASDGISTRSLESIYRKLYYYEYIENRPRFFRFIGNHQLLSVNKSENAIRIGLQAGDTKEIRLHQADVVILCTGYRWKMPDYLSDMTDRITLENGRFQVRKDFSIQWEGPAENRIYVQNAARHSHGIADPNLSLMAWRSARIINSLLQKSIYDIDNENTVMEWGILPDQQDENRQYA